MKRNAIAARAVPLVLAALLALVATAFATGCRQVRLEDVPGAKGVSSETTRVPLGTAQVLDTTIRMHLGVLRLRAAETSSAALEASFIRVPGEWQPEVGYSVDATKGALVVRQPDAPQGFCIPDDGNEWSLALARSVPTTLTLELGLGESTVNLRDVDVRRLDIAAGIGKATIDLTGPRDNDVAGRINCGVGDLTLIVPKDVGVRITGGGGGIGTFEAPGFSRTDEALVNPAWNEDGTTIDLKLTQGVGKVTVKSVE